MRTIRFILAAILLAANMAASAATGGKETVTIKTNIYCDHCKQCESCGQRIYDKLVNTPGVQKVKIDEEAATITVTYNTDKLDVKALRDAINEVGFDADDQPAPAEAVAKLDACCQKQ